MVTGKVSYKLMLFENIWLFQCTTNCEIPVEITLGLTINVVITVPCNPTSKRYEPQPCGLGL